MFGPDQLVNIRFNSKGSLINKIYDDTLFRSPLTCTATDSEGHRGICQKCYGLDPSTGRLPEIGLPVGILAAQAVGERVSQETLKSFHTGGKKEDKKKGLFLVKYLRRMVPPKAKKADSKANNLFEVFDEFSKSSRPSLVHFEVVLLGDNLKSRNNNILSNLAKSQAFQVFMKYAIDNAKDDLYDAVSRIVSGRIINSAQR